MVVWPLPLPLKFPMSKPTTNRSDDALPRSAEMKRLSEEEKAALEKGELAEHAHGEEREKLQKEAGAQASEGETEE